MCHWCRFWHCTGLWPRSCRSVSWAFGTPVISSRRGNWISPTGRHECVCWCVPETGCVVLLPKIYGWLLLVVWNLNSPPVTCSPISSSSEGFPAHAECISWFITPTPKVKHSTMWFYSSLEKFNQGNLEILCILVLTFFGTDGHCNLRVLFNMKFSLELVESFFSSWLLKREKKTNFPLPN